MSWCTQILRSFRVHVGVTAVFSFGAESLFRQAGLVPRNLLNGALLWCLIVCASRHTRCSFVDALCVRFFRGLLCMLTTIRPDDHALTRASGFGCVSNIHLDIA